MIEDVMQSSAPKFIYSVRISDMSQGSNPFRITSIRSLPDAEGEEALSGLPEEEQERLKGKHIVSTKLDTLGTTYLILQNLEISFVYRAHPSGSSAMSKANNAQ